MRNKCLVYKNKTSPSHECFAKQFKIPSMTLSLRRFAKLNRNRFGGHIGTCTYLVHAFR